MARMAQGRAQSPTKYFRLYDKGLLSDNELFPAVLDSFSEASLSEELDLAGQEIRTRLNSFLTQYRPGTFRPYVIGQQPTAEKAVQWEQERRRKYAALLVALGIDGPPPA